MLLFAALAAGLLSFTPLATLLFGDPDFAAASEFSNVTAEFFDGIDREDIEKRNPLAPLTWAFYAGPAFPGPRRRSRPIRSFRKWAPLLPINAAVLAVSLGVLTSIPAAREAWPVMLMVAATLCAAASAVILRQSARKENADRPPQSLWQAPEFDSS